MGDASDGQSESTASSSLTRRLTAPNPGPMTLKGTNSYLISAPGSDSVVVVDPGPPDDAHLAGLASGLGSGRRVELVLLTHRHRDHSESREAFATLTGAPVRAFDPALCVDAAPLTDGELIEAAGTGIRVLHTPGHTSDSVCLQLADDGPGGAVLTGDTILGRGSTIIDFPDGTLGDYLDSLDRLRALGPCTVLPGHGPVLPDLAVVCDDYRVHREQRLEELRAALAQLGRDATADEVTDFVYGTLLATHAGLRFAAEASVRAQLAYLRA